MMYGIEMDEDDLEEYGLLAWEEIGNRNRKLYRYSINIDPKDNSITLPCNALDMNGDSCVELVTTFYEDWNSSTNTSDYGDPDTAFTELYIESAKRYLGPYYLPGKILNYELVGDKLYFTHDYGRVNVLYKGIIADEDGLPELSDKEALAIATYIAYVTKFKEGLKTNNAAITNQAVQLQSIWSKLCDLARIKRLSQNEMDLILEAGASWDRKRYGKGYKILR